MTFKQHFNISVLKECTSVGACIQDKMVLVKNRDRTYAPTIEIVREMINGIETAYMHDVNTDFLEGMNAAGIGIINTTLQGKRDENEGTEKERKTRKKSDEDGLKIHRALGFTDPVQILKSLDLYNRGLGGHTIVGCLDCFYSIEKKSFGEPVIKKYQKNDVVVRSNHGLSYPKQGYQTGKDRQSSLSRMHLASQIVHRSETVQDLLQNLRHKDTDVAGYLQPYRTDYKVYTTSQILLNLSELEMTFVVVEDTDFLKIENKLPKQYEPKIKINVQQNNG